LLMCPYKKTKGEAFDPGNNN